MKINVNTPEPVVLPPVTYDIIGLTEQEVRDLYVILTHNAIEEHEGCGRGALSRALMYQCPSVKGDVLNTKTVNL